MFPDEKATRRFWAKVALPDDNGCMLWTAAKNGDGYGNFLLFGESRLAHRVSLWLSDGAPQGDRREAAHSCRNRHCVAPSHLRWATPSENEADKFRHGTANQRDARSGNARLTTAQISSIQLEHARGGVLQKHLAARYGVDPSTISRVVRNGGRR